MKKNVICCDVCSCKYNRRGCDCDKDRVRVTEGQREGAHFCGSYECNTEHCEQH